MGTENKFREVTQDEFWEFVKSYPRKLVSGVHRIVDPPLKTYEDYTLGVWSESIVAKIVLNEFYDKPNKFTVLREVVPEPPETPEEKAAREKMEGESDTAVLSHDGKAGDRYVASDGKSYIYSSLYKWVETGVF